MTRFAPVLFLLLLTACGDLQQRGFSLPEGDVSKGKAVFMALGCRACHHVDSSNADLVAERDANSLTEIDVGLGGEVGRSKTYGELVTSIINPSHRIAPEHLPSRSACLLYPPEPADE